MKEDEKYEKWVIERYRRRGASSSYDDHLDHQARAWFYDEVSRRKIKSVLDVGCGQGQDAYPIMTRGASYIGVDPVKRNLKRARRRWPDAKFRHGYIQDLDFLDNSVECVWSMSVWEGIPGDTMKKAIEECCRVAQRYVFNVDAGCPPGWFKERQTYVPYGWSIEFIRLEDGERYFTIWIIRKT